MEKIKVLLVDDEEEFVSALAERMTLRGIDAKAVFTCEDALRQVEADLPQCVVLDVMMPGLGGLEVLARIKKNHPELEVILLTGQGGNWEGVDEGKRLGAFACLMKPLSIDELIDNIRRALGERD